MKHGEGCKISKGTFVEKNVEIGCRVEILKGVRLLGRTKILNGVKIGPNCDIKDSIIGENSTITYSVIDGAIIGENNHIGPFSRIRPKTETGENVLLGNFVEIKNSFIGKGTKASHLAYVGDCDIGENVNIGCGAIFVNYNGKIKQRSVVKNNAFIGSNCNIVAPVVIEEGAYVCAGTTITKDVGKDEFVIGRVRQEHKEGLAKKFLDKD